MDPGCNESLTVLDRDGHAQDLYDVVLINADRKPELPNLAAMCPRCAINHREAATNRSWKELAEAKALLNRNLELSSPISSGDVGRQLMPVIGALGRYKPSKTKPRIEYKVAAVGEKINASEEFLLFHQVQDNVSTYYPIVHEILQDLEASGEIDTEMLRHNIKGDYLLLKRKSRSEVFTAITRKIARATKSSEALSAIVASYFVQSCDIFVKDPTLDRRWRACFCLANCSFSASRAWLG